MEVSIGDEIDQYIRRQRSTNDLNLCLLFKRTFVMSASSVLMELLVCSTTDGVSSYHEPDSGVSVFVTSSSFRKRNILNSIG